jgi:hypothetical protein
MTQKYDFDKEQGAVEFGRDDRIKVKEVLDRVLDEMGDNFTLDNMFAPYANIVHKVLTDRDIAASLADS